MKIGVAVLAYNRPKHLNNVLKAIVKEKIGSISIYIDGPEDLDVEKKQDQIFNLIKFYQKKIIIKIIKQSKNNGLAFSVINAVNSELKNNDAMIILEDDCVPLKGFFDFMKMGLKKYKLTKEVRSVCSYNNFQNSSNKAFFIKRFNPWGWATWKDRWKDYSSKIKDVINKIENNGLINTLPKDLRGYCKNNKIIEGKEDIWSLAWTLQHYLSNSLVLYPSQSLINNIGFDGSGVHCVETDIFKIKYTKLKKIKFPIKIKLDVKKEFKFNFFLKSNSNKTFFKTPKLNIIEPFKFIKTEEYILKDQIKFYVEKFVDEAQIFDVHTHLYPSKFKKFHKIGFIQLLNYHYLIAEFLSTKAISPKSFFKLNEYNKAKIIWNNLFLKNYPFSTAAKGVLQVLQYYGIQNMRMSFQKINEIIKKNNLNESDIFEISGVKKVVMTNNPFDYNELNLLRANNDSRYIPSIRIDDLFDDPIKNEIKSSYNLNKESHINKILNLFISLINNYKPAYFALSTENFVEFNKNIFFKKFLKTLEKYKKPLMLLIGVKRRINPSFYDAGDGLGYINFEKLENILLKYPNNNFLVTCLDFRDQFRLNVLARKFNNLKIFGFWWFNNNQSIIENLLQQRLELLGDGFIFQHSDARIHDQLIYKWQDFKNIYSLNMTKNYQNLLNLGFRVKPSELENKIKHHFEDLPKKLIKY